MARRKEGNGEKNRVHVQTKRRTQRVGCRAFDKEERLTTKKIVVSHFAS